MKHSTHTFLALQHLLLISGSKLSELGLCTRYCFNSFLSQAPQFKGFPKRKNSLRKRKKIANILSVYLPIMAPNLIQFFKKTVMACNKHNF